MSKKKITNEEIFEQVKKLQKQLDMERAPVPTVVYPNLHSHCTCQWCHPQPPVFPFFRYTITSGGTTQGDWQDNTLKTYC